MYGLGGQGVVTAAKALSEAVSIHEDKFAITVPAYGHERRGAPVFSDVIIDDERVLQNCFVYEPDLIVIFEDSILDKNVDVGRGAHRDTVVLLNTDSDEAVARYREAYGFETLYRVDATRIALDTIGRNIPNSAMLGAMAKTGAVKIESVEAALDKYFGEKAGEANARAAKQSYEQTARC